jgi:transposase
LCIDFITDFIDLSAFHIGSFEQLENEDWVVHLNPVSTSVPCPVCGALSTNHARPGRRRLRHRSVPGWHDVFVTTPIWRQRCGKCWLTFTAEWPGIPVRGKATDSFRRMCVERCHGRDFASVCREIGVKYSTLERWYYEEAQSIVPDPREYSAPSAVSLDEFALQKGHKYGINLMDADTGHVWQVTPGRSRKQVQEALDEQRLLHKEPSALREEEQQELKEWLDKDPALK